MIAILTIFDVLPLFTVALFALIGGRIGATVFGLVGGVLGGILGIILGWVLGRLPLALILRRIHRELDPQTNEELRTTLRSPNCLAPNLILLKLKSRGANIEEDLPLVVDWLSANDFSQRGRGWAALTSAFPEKLALISYYRLNDTVEECRRKTQPLHRNDSSQTAQQ